MGALDVDDDVEDDVEDDVDDDVEDDVEDDVDDEAVRLNGTDGGGDEYVCNGGEYISMNSSWYGVPLNTTSLRAMLFVLFE